MNSSLLYSNLVRFGLLFLLQMLLFKQITLLAGTYFTIALWPLFILFLPIETSTPLATAIGFFAGLIFDVSNGTLGLSASAGTFAAFARATILKAYEPKGGFSGKEIIASPNYFGWPWFLQVSGIFFFIYLFWFYSVDAFTFYYFGTIMLKTLAGWGLSMIFVVIYTFLSNPKN